MSPKSDNAEPSPDGCDGRGSNARPLSQLSPSRLVLGTPQPPPNRGQQTYPPPLISKYSLMTYLPAALVPDDWSGAWKPPRLRGRFIYLARVPWLIEHLRRNAKPLSDRQWQGLIDRLAEEAKTGDRDIVFALHSIRPQLANKIVDDLIAKRRAAKRPGY